MGAHGRSDDERMAGFLKKSGTHLLWIGHWHGATPRFAGSHVAGDVRKILWNLEHEKPFQYKIIRPTCGNERCVSPDHCEMAAGGRLKSKGFWEDRAGLARLAMNHGATLREVGEVLGVSRQCVQQMMKMVE